MAAIVRHGALLLLALHFAAMASLGDASRAESDGSSAKDAAADASTMACNVTSACLPCTAQQMEEEPSCKPTGYREAIRCVRRFAQKTTRNPPEGDDEEGSRNRRKVLRVPLLQGGRERGVGEGEGGREGPGWRLLLASADAESVSESFRSCNPEGEDTLSVLNFEGIMLVILGLCGRIVYQRKRRSAANAGMTSVPSNPRF